MSDSNVFDNENPQEGPRQPGMTLPTNISHPDDEQQLNSHHVYLRRDLVEVFEVKPGSNNGDCGDDGDGEDTDEQSSDDSESGSESDDGLTKREHKHKADSSSKMKKKKKCRRRKHEGAISKKHFPGRIGLRCVHCSSRPRRDRVHQYCFFPTEIDKIYRQTCHWQRVHFKNCPHVPDEVKAKYMALREENKRGSKKHWVKSARDVGFRDKGGKRGIYFHPTLISRM